ncbi:MAG: chromosome segregation protein SMC [Fusobacteriaceae bacterium]|nr:chromosome segregation protein SMC [Fusobacteriaceae bacterium]
MYLKAIEIHGFKSFGERVYIEFSKGITSIIGPNGSGKSNILDAVLWVLGEQSYKNIRAKENADLIFAGGKEIRNLNYAEVSLTMDNADRYFPYDGDSLKITRKLTIRRDVIESEYFINDSKARLKDIGNIFLDTGVGKTAYSVIGQGKVDRIINSLPKDIKAIIEEAAGIKKFQINKADALKKIANFEVNLEKIELITKEVQENRNRLEKQANQAVKFVELRDERDRYAKGIYTVEKDKKSTLLLDENAKKIDTEKVLGEVSVELERTKERQEEIKVEKDEVVKEIESINEQNRDLLNAVGDKKTKKGINEEKINSSKNTIGMKKTRIEGINRKIEEREQNLKDKELDKDEYEKNIKEIENEKSVKFGELENARKEVNELQAFYDTKNDKIASHELEKNKRDYEVETSTRRKNDSKEAIKNIKKELDDWEVKIRTVNANFIGKKSEIDVKEKIITERKIKEELLANESSEKSKKHSEINRLIESESRNYNIDSNKLKTLISDEENNEGYNKGAKEVLNSDIANIDGAFVDLVYIPEKYEKAIQAGAGGNLQDIIVSTSEVAKECIEMLKIRKAGRASFLALDTIKVGTKKDIRLNLKGVIGIAATLVTCDPKYEKISEFVLGNMLVVENMEVGLDVVKNNLFLGSVVTLSGELLSARGRITGGDLGRGGVSHILSRKREIRELTESVVRQEKNINANKQTVDILGKEIDELEDQSEQIGKSIKREEDNLKLCVEEYNQLKINLGELERDGDKFKAEIANEERIIKEYETRIDKNKNEWEALEDTIVTLRAELQDEDIKLTKIKKKLEEKIAESSTMDIRYQNLTDRYNEAKISIENFKKEIFELKIEAEIEDKDIDFNEKSIEEYQNIIITLTNEIKELEEKYERENEGVSEKQGILRNLNEEYEKLNDNRLHLQEKLQDKEHVLTRVNENIEKLNDDIFNLDENLKPLENIEGKLITLDNLAEEKDEFKKLNIKVNGFGDVNVLAIEEFKELQERLTNLKNQRDDLVKGKSQVMELLSEIDGNIHEKFYKAYDEINANFGVMCADTLNNSDGKLELINPENFDECGIDISVKHKNKKRLPLSLLSGGEKSMVAIAFVIAIFMYKPSPFAFLDEIEAALDETNTKKLLLKLKEFTQRSQFILITHNKTTMSHSDSILGVSMNKEVGVTKILGVNVLNLDEFLKKNKGIGKGTRATIA